MAYPVSRRLTRVSGKFGPRTPIKIKGGGYSPAFHGGVDFTPLVKGTRLPAYAVGRGVVYGVGLGGKAAGRNVMLRLSDGSLWWYCHLSRVDVVKGQTVEDGEQVGLIGATGNTTGVHLHLERHWPAIDVETDPWPYIKDEPDPDGKTSNTTGDFTMTEAADINDKLDRLIDGLLGETGRGIAIENTGNWIKQRLSGSVLSGPSITDLLNDITGEPAASIEVDVGQLAAALKSELGEAVADELGRRLTT